jgi:hypothetical protein
MLTMKTRSNVTAIILTIACEPSIAVSTSHPKLCKNESALVLSPSLRSTKRIFGISLSSGLDVSLAGGVRDRDVLSGNRSSGSVELGPTAG